MKIISAFMISGAFLGCGIVSLFFPPPDRYVHRDVTIEEIAGTWLLTSESESIVREFIVRYPNFSIDAPYKSIVLNSNGSCNVEWLKSHLALQTGLLICKWEIEKSQLSSGKDISRVHIAFEYIGNYTSYRSLNIFEEDGEIILWKYVGDPDDGVPQEFMKSEAQP